MRDGFGDGAGVAGTLAEAAALGGVSVCDRGGEWSTRIDLLRGASDVSGGKDGGECELRRVLPLWADAGCCGEWRGANDVVAAGGRCGATVPAGDTSRSASGAGSLLQIRSFRVCAGGG